MTRPLDVPPAVALALWLPLLGRAPERDDVVARAALAGAALASGFDRPLEQVLAGTPDPAALPGLLADLSPVTEAYAVLPAPGDPMGLPPGVEAPQDQAVVVRHGGPDDAGRALVLAPEVLAYGSRLEPGELLVWHATALERAPLAPLGTLAEARRDVHAATTDAIDAFEALDVARTAPDLADELNDVMLGHLDAGALPPGLDGRRLAVLESSARLLGLVDLALRDDGAALTGGQIVARREVLAPVARAARRAMCAASATAARD